MRVLLTDRLVLRAGKKSGVGHYACELAAALRRVAGDDVVCSWGPGRGLTWCQGWLGKQSARYETVASRPGTLAWAEKKVRGKFLATARALFPVLRNPYHGAVGRTRCTLYHEPNFIPLDLGLPTVVSVHDLSAVRYPEWHPPQRVAVFEKEFRKALGLATHLIAISEFGKNEIVNHLGWKPERVSVTYMGVRPGLRPVTGAELARGLAALGLSPGYLLHVGTVEPRKNIRMLLRAYCALPAAVRERHPLVLVGGKGWNADDTHAFLETDGKAHNVRWLGYAADDLFPALYSGARALVFPTFYEGFGMPTIEMMACGGAVLASTAGALAETVGHQAHLTDPHDEPGWRDAMLRACTDDDWWRLLRAGAEDAARPYTWDRCAEATLAAYRKALREETEVKRAA
jgi:alpha-1,3-rhamnosyl/mannosyltransferase